MSARADEENTTSEADSEEEDGGDFGLEDGKDEFDSNYEIWSTIACNRVLVVHWLLVPATMRTGLSLP